MIYNVDIKIQFGRGTDLREVRAGEKSVATLVGSTAPTKVILYGTFTDPEGYAVFGSAGIVVQRFVKTSSKSRFWAKVDGILTLLTVDELTSATVCAKSTS